MKKILFILCFLTHALTVFCQLQKMDAKVHLFVNLGIMYHTNKTISENNRIKGLPTADTSPSLRLLYFFKNHTSAVSIGIEHNTFTNKFKLRSGYNGGGYDGKSGATNGQGSYYKISLNYNYFIQILKGASLGFYAGPSYSNQRKIGFYDADGLFFVERDANNAIKYTSEYEFKAEKLVQNSFGGQLGCTLNCRFIKKSLLSLNMGYNFGFTTINRTEVKFDVNGINVDNATVYSKQNGINTSIGFSIPLE